MLRAIFYCARPWNRPAKPRSSRPFQQLFRDRGLPLAIRSDNGLPFASPNGLYNLSSLSVWWLRLGIAIERIKPGHPQQNGRHERMHLTLKKEATRPPGINILQQQARFDAFVREFNAERPHEALAMKCPAEFYTAAWWAVTDSNRRHSACKADALPTELTALRQDLSPPYACVQAWRGPRRGLT